MRGSEDGGKNKPSERKKGYSGRAKKEGGREEEVLRQKNALLWATASLLLLSSQFLPFLFTCGEAVRS